MPYVYQAFPKWVYHEDGRRIEVNSQSEYTALGTGWTETPSTLGTGTYAVTASIAAAVLFAPNPNAIFRSIYNHSTAAMYVKRGSGASADSFSFVIGAGRYFEFPLMGDGRPYRGLVTAAWATANGSAKITEEQTDAPV